MDKNLKDFIPYTPSDKISTGAADVIEAELEQLKQRQRTDDAKPLDADNLTGLALSGGGIRAASFSLGVLQALASKNRLQNFDYLSTVSGGGYLGGSLSWIWLKKWQSTNCNPPFGTQPDNFPFGTGKRFSNADAEMDRHQASLMRHLRQYGKYLTPDRNINLFSFVSVILRSVVMGLVSILLLASLMFHLLYDQTSLFTRLDGGLFPTLAIKIAAGSILLYLLALLVYAVQSLLFNRSDDTSYLARRTWEIVIKYVLLTSLFITVVAFVPLLREKIAEQYAAAGGLTAAVGAAIAWFTQKSLNTTDSASFIKHLPRPLMINAGLLLLLIGMLVMADQLTQYMQQQHGLLPHLLLVLVLLLLAAITPINKVSIHRYYRDRLMETFMPDVHKVLDNNNDCVARFANKTPLSECLPEQRDMPYHIINSNLILVASNIAKFRGRGGDNFILSPLYCGSNATGWRYTQSFAGNSLTLPTAVAISGAAANSDSGVAGNGLTMNPILSTIMSIFNLRLGYWVGNPDPQRQKHPGCQPSYLIPGFNGVLYRHKLNEEARFVQLSDGGHFENLAVYELLRRQCKFIVCCDAEQDSDFKFEGLGNLLEKARVDFGTEIQINDANLQQLKYTTDPQGQINYAKNGYLLADINYPNGVKGHFLYIKTTLVENLPADLMAYKSAQPDFPDESTLDQFFDEKQLEAYRLLGMQIALDALTDSRIPWA